MTTVLLILFATLVILSLLAVWVLKPRMHYVQDEERYVIYEFGRFKRIGGPGPVLIWASSENIERKVNVRNEPKNIVIGDLYIYDIPFGYKLNFWSRFDPDMFRNTDPKRMAELLQFEDQERHQQMIVKVRDALVNSVVTVQNAQPSSPQTVIEKILLIAPGLDGYKSIMHEMRNELNQTLPLIGMKLDLHQPITTTNLYLDRGVGAILNRDRIVEQVKEKFHDLSPTEEVQALSAIEGLSIPAIHNISTKDLANSNYNIEFDAREGEDGLDVRSRMRQGKPQQRPMNAETSEPETEAAVDPHPQQEATDHQLTADDLAVLKKIA